MKHLSSLLLAAGALGLAACGSSESDPTPTACLNDADIYLTALEGAPGSALLEGSVPIGDCLVADQPAGELNTVGAAIIAAATELNRQAQERPSGSAARGLGYLVGSVEESAAATAGIHTDLVRRLNSAARFSAGGEGLPAAFERTFGAAYVTARAAG